MTTETMEWREDLAKLRAKYTQAEVAAKLDPPRDVRTVWNWEHSRSTPRLRDQRRLELLASRLK
jgi:hypothetical protein